MVGCLGLFGVWVDVVVGGGWALGSVVRGLVVEWRVFFCVLWLCFHLQSFNHHVTSSNLDQIPNHIYIYIYHRGQKKAN